MAIAMSLPTFKIMVMTVVYCYVVRVYNFLNVDNCKYA